MLLSFTFTENAFCSAFWFTQQVFFLDSFCFWVFSSPRRQHFFPRAEEGPWVCAEESQNLWLRDSEESEERSCWRSSHVGCLQVFERLINHHSFKNRFMLYFCPEKSTKELPRWTVVRVTNHTRLADHLPYWNLFVFGGPTWNQCLIIFYLWHITKYDRVSLKWYLFRPLTEPYFQLLVMTAYFSEVPHDPLKWFLW